MRLDGPMRSAKSIVNALCGKYINRVCREEFLSQTFVRFNERPVEFQFVFQKLYELYPLNILDVGTGTTALPHVMRNCGFLVTAIDNIKDYWPEGMVNRHYHVINDDITSSNLKEKYDLITCVSVLEHIEKSDDAISEMFGLLQPGGHLIVTFPYNEREYVRNVYDLPDSSYGRGSPYITQSYSRANIQRWTERNAATIVEQQYWRFWEGDFWTEGNQVIPPQKVSANESHQLTCLLLRKDGGN